MAAAVSAIWCLEIQVVAFCNHLRNYLERTPQCAKGNIPVHGDDAAAFTLRRDLLENDMAATLAIHEESKPLESFDRLRAGHDGQFSHEPIRTCESRLAF